MEKTTTRSAADEVRHLGDEEILEMMLKGKELCRDGKFDEGLEIMSDAVDAKVRNLGDDDLSEDLAPLYYDYGVQLLNFAEHDSELFGAGVQAAAAAREDRASDAVAEDIGEGVTDGSNAEEEGSEAEAEDAGQSLLERAWEFLETARVIWERDVDKNAKRLMDCHSALADILLEEDNIPEALKILEEALTFAKERNGSKRLLSDLMGLGLFIKRDFRESHEKYVFARDTMKEYIDSISSDESKKAEVVKLREILSDMDERVRETNSPDELENVAKEAAMMKMGALLDEAVPSSAKEELSVPGMPLPSSFKRKREEECGPAPAGAFTFRDPVPPQSQTKESSRSPPAHVLKPVRKAKRAKTEEKQ